MDPPVAERPADPRQALDEVLGTLAAGASVPSLVVCAGESEGRDDVFGFTAGFADRESDRMPTLDTVYGLGSTSKAYVGVSVLRLVADGRLRLHAPIADIVPRTKQLPIFDGVTVHHLLTHTSGLPPLDARYAAADRAAPGEYTGGIGRPRPPELALAADTPGLGFVDHAGLLDYLGAFDLAPLAAPGRQFSYSNEGYVLLAGLVSEVAGVPYEEFCRTHVLEPLGLSSTAFIGSAEAAALPDVATPYRPGDDGPSPTVWWDAPAWAGPGGLLASARDLLRFAHALQHRAVPGIPDDLAAAMTARHAVRSTPGEWYGYGVGGGVVDGRSFVGHGGGRVGTAADMVWIEDGPAAVAFVNHAAGPATSATRAALLALSGDDPGRVLEPPQGGPYLPAEAIDLARIAGTYVSAEGGTVQVRSDPEGGSRPPQVIFGTDPAAAGIALKAVTANRYEAVVGAGVMPLQFLIDGLGPAWGVELGGRVLTRALLVRRRPD